MFLTPGRQQRPVRHEQVRRRLRGPGAAGRDQQPDISYRILAKLPEQAGKRLERVAPANAAPHAQQDDKAPKPGAAIPVYPTSSNRRSRSRAGSGGDREAGPGWAVSAYTGRGGARWRLTTIVYRLIPDRDMLIRTGRPSQRGQGTGWAADLIEYPSVPAIMRLLTVAEFETRG